LQPAPPQKKPKCIPKSKDDQVDFAPENGGWDSNDEEDIEHTDNEFDDENENEYDTEDSFIDDSEAPPQNTMEANALADLESAEMEDALEQQQQQCMYLINMII